MNIETSESGPKLNLLKPDGVRDQASATDVTCVLLDGEGWINVIPGSFHFYKTAGDKPVPFVQFDIAGNPASPVPTGNYRVEVFPTAIAGLAYPITDDE
jgi:hypothetical protein